MFLTTAVLLVHEVFLHQQLKMLDVMDNTGVCGVLYLTERNKIN